MNRIFIFMAAVMLAFFGCAKKPVAKTPGEPVTKTTTAIPHCVQNIIKQKKQEKPERPAASIYRYQYHGNTVYFIPAKCCDIPSKVIDEHCVTLCFPSGGYAGKGDGKCADFLKEATEKALVWKDPRGK